MGSRGIHLIHAVLIEVHDEAGNIRTPAALFDAEAI